MNFKIKEQELLDLTCKITKNLALNIKANEIRKAMQKNGLYELVVTKYEKKLIYLNNNHTIDRFTN